MPDQAAGRRLLLSLFLIAIFNAMDRQILVVLLEPIRLEFGASDAAMGLLTGFAFVLFYSLSTLPIARLADLRPRRTIILVGLSCWSAMTAVCGVAGSFWQLALSRVGVGVGEAAFLPAGMSMISDRFPQERRPVAMAMLMLAFPMGIMISFVVGGRLGEAIGWRMTMVLLGGVGLMLALLLRTSLVEPARGLADEETGDRELYGVGETIRYLVGLSSLRNVAAGAAIAFFAGNSVAVWSPAFLMRVHGLDLAATGIWLGPAMGVGGISGVLVGGFVAQRMARRDIRWLTWAPALAQILFVPASLLLLTQPTVPASIPGFVGTAFCSSAMMAPSMTVVQGLAKLRMRALAAAVVSMTINLAGIGLGPLVAGVLSDALRPRFGEESIRYALLVTALASLWAAAHFVLAGRRLRQELEGARTDLEPFSGPAARAAAPSTARRT